jgi:hypothetical protein
MFGKSILSKLETTVVRRQAAQSPAIRFRPINHMQNNFLIINNLNIQIFCVLPFKKMLFVKLLPLRSYQGFIEDRYSVEISEQ